MNPRPTCALVFAVALLLALGAAAQPALGPPPGAAPAGEQLAVFQWDTTLGALARSWPGLEGLRGAAKVTLELTEAAPTPRQVLTLHAPAAALDGVELGELRVLVRRHLGDPAAHVRLSLAGPGATSVEVELAANLEVDVVSGAVDFSGGPVKGRLSARGVNLEVLSRLRPGLGLAGLADVDAELSGDAGDPHISATVSAPAWSWRTTEYGRVAATWRHAARLSQVKVQVGAHNKPLLVAQLSLPLRLDLAGRTAAWLDREALEAKVQVSGLDAARLRPFWRLPPGCELRLDGQLQAEGPLQGLSVRTSLAGELTGPGHSPLALRATGQAGPRKQQLELKLGEGAAALRLETAADLVALRRGSVGSAAIPASGTLAAKLPLEVLGPYLPSALYEPRGTLQADVSLDGTLGKPQLEGQVQTLDAAVTVLPLNLRLRPLELDLRLKGRTLRSERVHARSAGGEVTGEVELTLQTAEAAARAPRDKDPGPFAGLALQGRGKLVAVGLPVVQPGLPVGRADAVVELLVGVSGAERTLELVVRSGAVRLGADELPEAQALPRRQDGSDDGRALAAADDGWQHGPDPVRRALTLRFAEPLTVEGPDLSVALGGGWAIELQGGVATVEGALELLPGGRFMLFDNPFRLERGELRLPGGRLHGERGGLRAAARSGQVGLARAQRAEARPLEPVVSFVAQGVAVDTRVLVAVHGPTRRPELVLFSSPSLPEYQIMTLLITGRADAVDDRNGEVRRKVAAMVHRFDNPSLSRQLYDRIGVDRLGLGFGSSVSQPILTVGKQVTRQLYVETVYHHNAPPTDNEKEGHVEYRLNPNWTVDTTYGDAAQGSAGLFWRNDFGGPPPPEVGDDLEAFAAALRLPAPDSDSDGLADPEDRCPADPEDLDTFADDDGCPDPDDDGDGIPDLLDAAPRAAETPNGYLDSDGAPDTLPPTALAVRTSLRPITFERNGARVPEAAMPTIEALGKLLGSLPVASLRVVGHSDVEGAEPVNLRVSTRRAEQVADLLRAAGAPAERVLVQGVGAARPLERDPDPDAQARNRRVELEVSFGEAPGGVR